MPRKLRTAIAAIAVVLLGVAASGCEWVLVTVRVPDFESAQVDGFWLCLRDQSGSFVPVNQVEFLGTSQEQGLEVLHYRFHDGSSGYQYDLSSAIERDPNEPDSVTVRVLFADPLPGDYKVYTYNGSGLSDLSLETLEL